MIGKLLEVLGRNIPVEGKDVKRSPGRCRTRGYGGIGIRGGIRTIGAVL